MITKLEFLYLTAVIFVGNGLFFLAMPGVGTIFDYLRISLIEFTGIGLFSYYINKYPEKDYKWKTTINH